MQKKLSKKILKYTVIFEPAGYLEVLEEKGQKIPTEKDDLEVIKVSVHGFVLT